MQKDNESTCGYIVFEDGGIQPICYGAAESWFPTYDTAIEHAMNIVSDNIERYKRGVIDCNSVIVYEADESVLHSTHNVPCGRVVFHWNNYKERTGGELK